MKKIRFMHIQKTAGVSLFDCLSRIYKGDAFVFIGDLQLDLERYDELPPSQKEQIVLFGGHAPRFTGREAIDRLPTITLLRHPIRRVISLCQYVSEGKSPYLLDDFPPETFQVNRFLGSGNYELWNFQARTILGNENYELPDLDQELLIEKAVDVLTNDLKCFGIVEHINESLTLFRRTLAWKELPVLPRLNEGSREKPIAVTEEQIARIGRMNALDIAIYERALSIFHERLEKETVFVKTNFFRFLRRQMKRA